MSEKVFIDTGAFIALTEGESLVFLRTVGLFEDLSREGCKLFTTDYVLDELLTWMRCKKRFDIKRVIALISSVRVADIQIVGVTQDLFGDALKLMKKYDDQFFSFTDCVSFEVMKEMKIKDVVATDKHFAVAGFNNLLNI